MHVSVMNNHTMRFAAFPIKLMLDVTISVHISYVSHALLNAKICL